MNRKGFHAILDALLVRLNQVPVRSSSLSKEYGISLQAIRPLIGEINAAVRAGTAKSPLRDQVCYWDDVDDMFFTEGYRKRLSDEIYGRLEKAAG